MSQEGDFSNYEEEVGYDNPDDIDVPEYADEEETPPNRRNRDVTPPPANPNPNPQHAPEVVAPPQPVLSRRQKRRLRQQEAKQAGARARGGNYADLRARLAPRNPVPPPARAPPRAPGFQDPTLRHLHHMLDLGFQIGAANATGHNAQTPGGRGAGRWGEKTFTRGRGPNDKRAFNASR